jgi:branched-chain amino acid transport system permease protein
MAHCAGAARPRIAARCSIPPNPTSPPPTPRMDATIALFLAQDGIVNGAIYALIALAIVLVFTVTRVLFVPQGEFVTFGALSLAAFQLGRVPGLVWVLALGGLACALVELVAAVRSRRYSRLGPRLALYLALPGACIALAVWVAPQKSALALQVFTSVALVTALGPMVYRLAFQPLANASVLVLLIVAVAVHFALQGLGLIFFGAEGYRVEAFSAARVALGAITVTGQQMWVLGATGASMAALALFFGRTLTGKALRATAINRLGARLVGIAPATAGTLAFTLAALMGAMSGVLIIGLTTLYYDSGFLIGLKGFVASVFGAVLSYPMAVAGAVVVGVLESFGSFWSSAYKETIVFSVLIPVLLWLSLRSHHVEEEEEE